MLQIGDPPEIDGFLAMSEVSGLDLNNDLVVFSACNTYGKGENTGSSEGFIGLTRSFMYEGSKSLIVTHLNVESEATRDLMINIFLNLNDNTRAEALRNAKLNMKNSYKMIGNIQVSLSHPFF